MSAEKCTECGVLKSKEQFSKTQWSKKDGKKCKDCITGNANNKVDSSASSAPSPRARLFTHSDGNYKKCSIIYHDEAGWMMVECGVDEDGEPKYLKVHRNRLIPFNQDLVGKPHNIRKEELQEFDDDLKSTDPKPKEPKSTDPESTENADTEPKESTKPTNSMNQMGTMIGVNEITQIVAIAVAQSLAGMQNGGHSKTLLDETRVTDFSAKFPKNRSQFFNYLNSIHIYQAKNASIPPETVFRKIIQSLSDHQTLQWEKFQDEQYHKHIRTNKIQHDDAARAAFHKEKTNVDQFELFLLKHLQIHTDFSDFQTQLSFVQYRWNENPEEVLKRIDSYYWQIDRVRSRLTTDANGLPIRPFSEQDKMDLIQRVFIKENNSDKFNNDGMLNKKVKTTMSKNWRRIINESTVQNEADGKVTTAIDYSKAYPAISRYISQDLAEKVLPILCQDFNDENMHWKIHSNTASVFQLKSMEKKDRGQKRKFRASPKESKSKTGGTNPRKRRKVDSRFKRKCKYGAACRDLLEKKQCNYQHTVSELRKAGVPKPASTSTDGNDRAWKGKSGSGHKSGKPCRYGVHCNYWQRGYCRDVHNKWEMKCNQCGKAGHPAANCRSKGDPPAYNPVEKMNHDGPKAHQFMMKQEPVGDVVTDRDYRLQKLRCQEEKTRLNQMMIVREYNGQEVSNNTKRIVTMKEDQRPQ